MCQELPQQLETNPDSAEINKIFAIFHAFQLRYRVVELMGLGRGPSLISSEPQKHDPFLLLFTALNTSSLSQMPHTVTFCCSKSTLTE